MATTITTGNYQSVFSDYGISFSETENGITVTGKTGESATFKWTKAGRIPPKSKVWDVLRAYPAFQKDYPKTGIGRVVNERSGDDPAKLAFWTKYDVPELKAIAEVITEAIEKRKAAERQADLDTARELLEKHGISIPEGLK